MQYHLMGLLIIIICQGEKILFFLTQIFQLNWKCDKKQNKSTFNVSWIHRTTFFPAQAEACRIVIFFLFLIFFRQCLVQFNLLYGFFKFSYLFFKCPCDLHFLLALSFCVSLSGLQVCQSSTTHTHTDESVCPSFTHIEPLFTM